ncbi:MAG TPA: thioesterase family protein [Stellaceae bacterium]|nr:thioesterase family protein [Stellaceae bacterium]
MNIALPHFETAVRPEWIDYNGHMNMAYYVVVFDQATDVLFDTLGVGQAYRRDAGHSMYALESHVTYARETKLGDPLRVEDRLIDADAKRFHFFLRMTTARTGDQVATFEMVVLHVDLAGPRATPFPAAIQARIDAMLAEHRTLPPPPEVGRRVGLKR